MPEEPTSTQTEGQGEPNPVSEPSAATKNTEAQKPDTETSEQSSGHMIPKSRFDDVSKRLKEAEKKLGEKEKAQADAERKQQEEQGRFQQLYESERQKREAAEQALTGEKEANRVTRLHHAIRQEAMTLHFGDPADAVTLLNLDALEVNDAGEPTNLKALVEQLAKDKPYLLAEKLPAPGNGRGPRPANPQQVAHERDEKARAAFRKQIRQGIKP
jgi:hypothetical protein